MSPTDALISQEPPKDIVGEPLNMRGLSEVLVKHYGLTDGHYELVLGFQIGTGAIGPDKASAIPGLTVGIMSVGLRRAEKPSSGTVDAASLVAASSAAK